MKHLRKSLPLMLVVLLALGMAGCGSGGDDEAAGSDAASTSASADVSADSGAAETEQDSGAAEAEGTAEAEEAESIDNTASIGVAANEETAEPEVEYEHGTIDEYVYMNDFFGFTFTADDSWSFSDEDELSELNQNVGDIIDNETVTEALKNGVTFIDMQAADSSNPLTNVNLTVTYSPGSFDISSFNDATINQMTKMYQDAGFEDVSITTTTAKVDGEEIDALLTKMTVQGNSIVEKQIFFSSNGYLGTFTVSGFDESDCDLLMNALSIK